MDNCSNELMKYNPIGVYDSGMGGISTLRQLIKIMPNEQFVYFGDDANAPYGNKTHQEVISLTKSCVDYLFKVRNVKALVLACNTITGIAGNYIRNEYKDNIIIGAEPALKLAYDSIIPSFKNSQKPRILVMATTLTLESLKFSILFDKYSDKADVIKCPCPGLVDFIEKGVFSGTDFDYLLYSLISDYIGKIDAVVLGCTHYPFIRSKLSSMFGTNVKIFDGNGGIARQTLKRLKEKNLLNESDAKGKVFLETSRNDSKTISLANYLLYEHQY